MSRLGIIRLSKGLGGVHGIAHVLTVIEAMEQYPCHQMTPIAVCKVWGIHSPLETLEQDLAHAEALLMNAMGDAA